MTACNVDMDINLSKVMEYLLSTEDKCFAFLSVLIPCICIQNVIETDIDTHISQGLDGHSIDKVGW